MARRFGRCVLLWIALWSALSSPVFAEPFWYGLELGELPVNGSRKLGLSLGQGHWMASWQRADTIRRDDSSFNAELLEWDGLDRSSESVGARWQVLYQWHLWRYQSESALWVPYLTTGWVWNRRDTERLRFDDRKRHSDGPVLDGPVQIQIRRPSGHGLALGAGFLWQWSDSGQIYCHWSGAVLEDGPEPEVNVQAQDLSADQKAWIQRRITRGFKRRLTNRYHLFSLGIRFPF